MMVRAVELREGLDKACLDEFGQEGILSYIPTFPVTSINKANGPGDGDCSASLTIEAKWRLLNRHFAHRIFKKRCLVIFSKQRSV